MIYLLRLGFPGEYERPEVKRALMKIEQTAKRFKIPLGFHVIESSHQKILDKITAGYSFIAFSLDFFFLGDKARDEMKSLKERL